MEPPYKVKGHFLCPMHLCKKGENGTPGADQSFPTAATTAATHCHPKGDTCRTHLPHPMQSLSSKEITPADNVQPNVYDNFSCLDHIYCGQLQLSLVVEHRKVIGLLNESQCQLHIQAAKDNSSLWLTLSDLPADRISTDCSVHMGVAGSFSSLVVKSAPPGTHDLLSRNMQKEAVTLGTWANFQQKWNTDQRCHQSNKYVPLENKIQ